jgi:hypothetical protein
MKLYKPLVFWLLIAGVFYGCIPTTQEDALTFTRADTVVFITATLGSTLVISSSEEIVGFVPAEACDYVETSAGQMFSLECPSPVTVTINTSGSVSAQIIDGDTFVTAPKVIPK